MTTKCYIITGMDKHTEQVIDFTQPCGSVTEVCKYLKKMYNLNEMECRMKIIQALVKSTKVEIEVTNNVSALISQHKLEPEVRLHGCW